MAVTPQDVAIELGRSTPTPEQAERWSRWIARADRAIRTRAERMGVDFASLDPLVVDDVVLYAVVRRESRPVDGAESVTDRVTVDDGTVDETRKFPTGQGDMFFLDEWWRLLGLMPRRGVVGSFRIGIPGHRLPKVGM